MIYSVMFHNLILSVTFVIADIGSFPTRDTDNTVNHYIYCLSVLSKAELITVLHSVACWKVPIVSLMKGENKETILY